MLVRYKLKFRTALKTENSRKPAKIPIQLIEEPYKVQTRCLFIKKMWKSILLNSAFLNRGRYLGLNRTYLTETCKLNSEWAARLKTPILEKVNIENYFYELDTKFSQQKVLSFIDVDIYANKISDDKHIDEIADLLHKLRTTAEAHKLCESTSHAVIRNYIDTNHIDSLVQVLDHRLEYGVFLDPFAANILLDKLIEEKNFKLGARMATILALQEDFENPITRYMALYSCYKFLENLEEFDDLIVHKPEDAPSDGKKKKVEEIKVRVRYIRNTFSDDHFDLRISNHLLGKAFIVLGDEVRSCNETLAYSCKLIGFALYEKFDLANLLVSDQVPFFKEAVEFVRRLVSKCKSIESNEAAKRFLDSIDGIQNSVDANVGELIEGHLKKAIADNLQKDIQHQKQVR